MRDDEGLSESQFEEEQVEIWEKAPEITGKLNRFGYILAAAYNSTRKELFRMKPGIRFGILGGGQLARMLALSAHQMGLTPWILSEKEDDPAQQVCTHGMIGSLDDKKILSEFLKKVDVATFESEFLDASLLVSVDTKKKISPSPKTMELLQDREPQKKLLDDLKIATAPWISVSNTKEAEYAVAKFKLPVVFKKRRYGYDGYGTFIIKTKKDLQMFCKKQLSSKSTTHDYIAEQWIPFERELACIFARNPKGDVVHYPLVESFQKNARCFWVKGPIEHKLFNKWATKFKALLKKTNYVGVMGVELFETPKGLLVNELAPRVHNSGHYTQDAFSVSQFDLHIKAILDQELTLPKQSAPGFAMVNLLGNDIKPKSPQWDLPKETSLHWYGKVQNRAGRKMGHINVLGSTADDSLKIALKSNKRFKL